MELARLHEWSLLDHMDVIVHRTNRVEFGTTMEPPWWLSVGEVEDKLGTLNFEPVDCRGLHAKKLPGDKMHIVYLSIDDYFSVEDFYPNKVRLSTNLPGNMTSCWISYTRIPHKPPCFHYDTFLVTVAVGECFLPYCPHKQCFPPCSF